MDGLTDFEYIKIVNKYLNNDKFQKTKDIEQHGTTRYEHSLKVSYYSYKLAKFLRLNYEETAVGGLLHDFFLSYNDMSGKEKLKAFFTHPKDAMQTASEEFNLTKLEKDIIRNHMFPTTPAVPKYMESWIVCFIDKCVATSEFSFKFRKQLRYSYNLFVFALLGLMK